MEWPEVVILLVTFKRTECALATVKGLKENLDYPNLRWHVADDGSGKEHQNAIIEAINEPGKMSLTDAAQRGGTGYNRNVGLNTAWNHSPFVLHIEDDWALKHRYDLRAAVTVLKEHEDVGMIRLGYLEYGHMAKSVLLANLVWWDLQKTGHSHVFAGHPHLLHKRFHDAYGMYPEGLLPGHTELGLCDSVNAKRNGPRILYPIWHFCGFFAHIGSVKAEAYL